MADSEPPGDAALEELAHLLEQTLSSAARVLLRTAQALEAIPPAKRPRPLTPAERDSLLIKIAHLGDAKITISPLGRLWIKTDITVAPS